MPTTERPHGHPARQTTFILVWSRLGIEPVELADAAGGRKGSKEPLRLMPLQPSSEEKQDKKICVYVCNVV